MSPIKGSNKWKKPPTSVYENNYSYGIHFYQPMIDYISAKEQGYAAKPPHLPWNNDRGLSKYRFDEPIRTYSAEDLKRISHKIAGQAQRDLNKFGIVKRSPFSVVATAAAANITKHIGVENVTVKTKKKKSERIKQNRNMSVFERESDLYNKGGSIYSELETKAIRYRGKSANAIANTLLSESRRNAEASRTRKIDYLADNYIAEKNIGNISKNTVSKSLAQSNITNTTEIIKSVRTSSPTRCIVRVETEVPVIDD